MESVIVHPYTPSVDLTFRGAVHDHITALKRRDEESKDFAGQWGSN